MASMAGKARAAKEWAGTWPEIDGYIKLNALITNEGEATLATAANDVALEEYNDGTAKRQYTFLLKVVTAWSDGYDSVNVEAERLAASWLDWVSEQFPDNTPDWPGASILSIEPTQNAPILDTVWEDDGLAQYVIQAVIIYIE